MTSAFPLSDVDAFVAIHNIAGEGGVLNAANDTLERRANIHYAARAIDHLPATSLPCYVLTPDAAGLAAQAEYRGALNGMHYTPIEHLDEVIARGHKNILYLPYIRLKDPQFPAGANWIPYGLPPQATAQLKDKGYMHEWLVNHGLAELVPNFVVCHAGEMETRGAPMIRQVAALLEEFDMRGRYPAGLVIRSALSDGNYGMAVVMEAAGDMILPHGSVRRGQFVLKPDGKTEQAEVFDTAEEACRRVAEHIGSQNNMSIDDRVVITRLMHLNVSPGLCTVVANDELFHFPFNGQFMAPGDTACTGTWTFSAAVGPEEANRLSTRYLEQSQALLDDLLGRFLAGYSNVYAMLNIDVMMPGALEAELYARAAARGPEYLGVAGRVNEDYQPRIHGDQRALFVEVNPRDTNWTLALKAVLANQGKALTVENLMALANGSSQVLTRDQWPLPQGINFDLVRERLLAFHHSLPPEEGFLFRMPDNPSGIILYAPTTERLLSLMEDAYASLETFHPLPTD